MTLWCVSQVNSDGYLPNRKQNVAVGLSIIHVAQHLHAALKKLRPKHSKTSESSQAFCRSEFYANAHI